MAAGPLRLIPATPGHRPLAIRIHDLVFKKAETPAEIRQVHELNYLTFVREIGQHPDHGEPLLIDKFHEKNLYLIAKRGPHVIAMVAVHDSPPFSVASRLPDPAMLDRYGPRPLEVRLLSVRPEERGGLVLAGLLWALHRLALAAGYSHLLASGVRRQLPLYERIGFTPIGPESQSGAAWFTPLLMLVKRLSPNMRCLAKRLERLAGLAPLAQRPGTVSLMPGPPQFSLAVRVALRRPPTSHRDEPFVTRFEHCRKVLRDMTGAPDVALMAGSGTLANECIAATLASRFANARGLVLVNGEFGERLTQQAQRWGLGFDVLRWKWGAAWRLDEIDAALADRHRIEWLWGVHCETSTGVLNPLAGLCNLAHAAGARVCLDCVSSIGSVPLDLRGVMLASGVSGKCLGAPAGIAIVMGDAARLERDAVRPPLRPDLPDVPVYLDASAAFRSTGPRFTLSSTLLGAMHAALRRYATPLKREHAFAEFRELSALVRQGIRRLGATPLADDAIASPAVTTFAPPMGYSPEHFGLLCRAYGFEINAKSPYLPERGLVQIATMGAVTPADCRRLFSALDQWSRSAG